MFIDLINSFIAFSTLQAFGRFLKLFIMCKVTFLAASAPCVALPTPSHNTAMVKSSNCLIS